MWDIQSRKNDMDESVDGCSVSRLWHIDWAAAKHHICVRAAEAAEKEKKCSVKTCLTKTKLL